MRLRLQATVLVAAALVLPAASTARPDPVGGGALVGIGADGAELPLPLASSSFTVEIAGSIARTTVIQRFENHADRPIEAIYVFPLPADAAVDRLVIHAGERTIRGVVKRREEAAAIYAEAKRNGVLASLLEQERPNVFTQALANLLPGEAIEVELGFVGPLARTDGAHELVLPLVVGPRYHPGAALPSPLGAGSSPDTTRVPDASRLSPPYLVPGSRSGHGVSIRVSVDAGLPVGAIESPSHGIDVARRDAQAFEVSLRAEDAIPNQDFVLRWKLAGEEPAASLLAHRGARGGYFTLQVEPPAEPGAAQARPRELVFVLDSSGSMHGWPMATAKAVIREALAQLAPGDTFQLVNFAEASSSLAPRPLPASPRNVERALSHLDAIDSQGGTEMLQGIRAALSPPPDRERLRLVLFLTDGYIGDEEAILAAVHERLGDARLFSLGVGTAVNRYLLDELALAGRGAVDYVRPDEDPDEVAARFVRRIARPVLTDLVLESGGADLQDLLPARLPDLFDGQPVVVHGRYGRGGHSELVLRGRLGGAPWVRRIAVTLPEAEPRFSGLASVWARARIAELSRKEVRRPSPELAEAITRLALDHQLVSRYSSFVAIDESPRTSIPGAPVVQPVEVPAGVDPHASGAVGQKGLLGSLSGKSVGSVQGGSPGSLFGAGGLGIGGLGTGGGGTGDAGGLGSRGRSGGYGTGAGKLGTKGHGSIPSLRAGSPVVHGSIDRETIARVIRRQHNEARYCYEKELQKQPALGGRLVLRLTLAATGLVAAAAVSESTLGSPEVESCLTAKARRWKFPEVPGGGVVIVSYPFVFQPDAATPPPPPRKPVRKQAAPGAQPAPRQ